MKPESEKDFLTYRNSKVPNVIRLAWTMFIVFCIVYMVRYTHPDLMLWLRK